MASGPARMRPPVWPATIFLLWTLMGVAIFLIQSSTNLHQLAETDPYQARFWSEMPLWAWVSEGLAVGTGLVGAISLMLRRSAAVWLSGICVIAALVQFSYTFFLTDILVVRGVNAILFPLIIIAMALAQTLYARSLDAKRLLRY